MSSRSQSQGHPLAMIFLQVAFLFEQFRRYSIKDKVHWVKPDFTIELEIM